MSIGFVKTIDDRYFTACTHVQILFLSPFYCLALTHKCINPPDAACQIKVHEFKDESTDSQSYAGGATETETQYASTPNSHTQDGVRHHTEDPFEAMDRLMNTMWHPPTFFVTRPARPPFAVPEAEDEQVDDRKSAEPSASGRWDPYAHSRRMWHSMAHRSPFGEPEETKREFDEPSFGRWFFRRPRRTRIVRSTDHEAPESETPSE